MSSCSIFKEHYLPWIQMLNLPVIVFVAVFVRGFIYH